MTKTVFPRAFLFAASLLAAVVCASSRAEAQWNLAPLLERSLQLSVPPGRALRGSPEGGERANRRVAQADCSSAAAEAAADSGGQVLSVSSRQQGGRTVCVVTVLVPGEDGGRPRKQTITIPQ